MTPKLTSWFPPGGCQTLLKRKCTGSLLFTLLTFLLTCSFNAALPQSGSEPAHPVKGLIMDADGKPLVGATISIKGKGTAVSADELGVFSIHALPGDTLVFSMVGMQTQEIRIDDVSKIVRVGLKAKTDQYNEAVVVGYGRQKKVTVTGSVATVNMADMRTPVRSLSNALAGKVAGVISVQSAGGEPGYDNPTFTIRGVGTFIGSTSPLIIVDGVQREDVNSTYGGAFNNIDPEDIESISLLKDASATAVYGAKGANGVLIITTRRGVAGKPRLSVKLESGVSGLTRLPKMVDGVNYMKLYDEAQLNDPSNTAHIISYSEERIQKTASGLDPYLYPNVNWIKSLYKNQTPMYNGNVNVSGGGDAMRYYLSMSFYDQDGQYKVAKLNSYNPNLNFKRYDFRSNVDVNLTKSTLLSLNIAAMLVNSRYPGNAAKDIWYAAFATNPVAFPVKYPDRWAGPANNGGSNPFNMLQNAGYTTEFKPSIQSVLTLTQKLDHITRGLSAMGRFSFDSYGEFDTERKGNNDLWYAAGRDASGNLDYGGKPVRTGSTYLGFGASSKGERIMYLEGNINYSRSFGPHTVGALLVYNIRNRMIGAPTNVKNSIPFRNQNAATRVTYSYLDKYLAEVNMGATGSENFAKGHRWGYFPAASIGWVASKEDFFAPLAGTFNLVKLRASHGGTGNDRLGYDDRFGYLTYIESSTGASFGFTPVATGGVAETVIGTENLTWEKSVKDNIGLEIGIKNKVNIVVDAFRDKRSQILIARNSLSPIAGYSSLSIYANMGKMENKGIDGSIEYNDRFGKNISLRVFGNVTYAKSKILFADQPTRIHGYQQWEGHRYGEYTGFVSKGLFVDQSDVNKSPTQTRVVYPGDLKFADLSGDGTVNQEDWTYLGKSSFPAWSYGAGFTVGYKGFELSALFAGVADVGIMANGTEVKNPDAGAAGVGVVPFAGIGQYPGNVLSNVVNRWTPSNPSQQVDYPRLTITNTDDNNYVNSSWWLKDGSFCRLRQASLGYTLSTAGLKRAGIGNMQFYVSGTNLLTFSKFKLWDPELGSNGAKYPFAKTVTVGMRAQF